MVPDVVQEFHRDFAAAPRVEAQAVPGEGPDAQGDAPEGAVVEVCGEGRHLSGRHILRR